MLTWSEIGSSIYVSSSNESEETKEQEKETQVVSENEQNESAKDNRDKMNKSTHIIENIDITKIPTCYSNLI